MIRLCNVSKYYTSDNNVALGLRKIDLELNSSEFIAITGESGSGKSTLLNVICGIDSYDEGEMYVDNEETSYYEESDWEKYRKDKVGFIFQNYNLIDSYSVIENVEVSMIIQGIDKKERRKRALQIIEEVGLEKHIHHKASKLSGGQKQRLAIARALAKNTKIIACDEPTGNLDSENGKEIIKLLYKISRNKTVIIVTHNYEEVANYATRKIRMYDGEIVEDKKIENRVNSEYEEMDDNSKETSDISKSIRLSLLNLKNQPKKTILLFVTCFLSLFAIFIYYISYYETPYETYYPPLSYNIFDGRLIITKKDRSAITSLDLEEIKSIGGDRICEYDKTLDISYSLDLTHESDGYTIVMQRGYLNTVSLIKDDLLIGRLPQEKNEIIIDFVNDLGLSKEKIEEMIINRTVDIDLRKGIEYTGVYKIVGVYQKESGINDENLFLYMNDEGLKNIANVFESESFSNNLIYYYEEGEKQYFEGLFCYIFLNENLLDNEIEVWDDLYQLLSFSQLEHDLYINDNIISIKNSEVKDTNNLNKHFMYVSKNIYDYLCDSQDLKQVSLLYESDASGENVLKKLESAGYYGFFPYSAPKYGFNIDVFTKLISLLGLVIEFLIIFVISYFIIRSIMISKKKDYAIFKTLGINKKVIKYMSFIEVAFVYLINYLLITIIFIILINTNVRFSMNYNYIGFIEFIYLFLITFAFSFLVSYTYNKYLEKRSIISSLKVE